MKSKSDEKVETVVTPKDPIAEAIGDVGRWQVRRIGILLLLSIPGTRFTK
jgi:hypothetical protein